MNVGTITFQEVVRNVPMSKMELHKWKLLHH